VTAYDDEDLLRAAAAGIRAPSMHNTQPWRFRLRDGAIEVLADPGRRLRIADAGGWAMRLACGAATFNARLALAANGTPATVALRPDTRDPLLMARLTRAADRPPTYAEQDLYAAVERRHSNRRPFWPQPVPPELRSRLLDAARAENAWLDLLVGSTALSGFAQLARSADRVLRRNPHYQSELYSWIHSETARDGVPTSAGGPLPQPGDLLPHRPFGDRRRAPGRDYEPEPLIAILGVAGDLPADQITAGQALQRVLLEITDAGLAASMISQPIEVTPARDQLRRSLGRSGAPQMALRIGYGDPGRTTPRRNLTDAVQIGTLAG
jgi:hypothetical protein